MIKKIISFLLICLTTWLSVSLTVSACRWLERVTYIHSMNRAQQAYFFENGSFAKSLRELDLPEKTSSFTYKTVPTSKGVFNYATYLGNNKMCRSKCVLGVPNFQEDRCGNNYFICFQQEEICDNYNHVGVVYLRKLQNSTIITEQIICKSNPEINSSPVWQNGGYVCGLNSELVK